MTDAAAVKPPKRNFFKKPDWLEAQVQNEIAIQVKAKQGADLFSRSEETQKTILADQERRKEHRAERKSRAELQEARERESIAKRRRISTKEEEEEEVGSKIRQSSPRLSPRNLFITHNAVVSPASRPKEAVVVDLEESSDEDSKKLVEKPAKREEGFTTSLNRINPIRTEALPADDPDEEFPELAAKARENARLREQERKSRESIGEEASPVIPSPCEHDPHIQVFIHSRIPDTAPLLVARKFSQDLKAIRIAWCARQGFTEEFTHSVFFTYRGHRVFDVATCKSLGITLDSYGRPIIKTGSRHAEDGDQIVLVATTQAILDEEKRIREAARKKEEDEAVGIVPVPEVEKEKAIRIVLKAKGHEDYRMIVKETTTFERIAGAFCKERKIFQIPNVSLHFDGEQLQLSATMGESEIEDMDSIEVHIKS